MDLYMRCGIGADIGWIPSHEKKKSADGDFYVLFYFNFFYSYFSPPFFFLVKSFTVVSW